MERYHNIITSSIISALAGASITYLILSAKKSKNNNNPETNHDYTKKIIWNCISGAMNASMMYIGDKLHLYKALSDCCTTDGSYVTSIKLAHETGLNERWIREWLANQASIGILHLHPQSSSDDDDDHRPSSLRYRLPKATAAVLSDPTSPHYDISMIQMVPSLVNRSKTMLPEAFRTGIGKSYDDGDITEAIDRQHAIQIRHLFLPKLLPKAANGRVLDMLLRGIIDDTTMINGNNNGGSRRCMVADLGCGAGNLLLTMATSFPHTATFHGYEISKPALDKASYAIAKSRLTNVFLHDANETGERLGDRHDTYDVVMTLDVLHDAPDPMDLIRQVRRALKPNTGVWLLGDLPSKDTVRKNIAEIPNAGCYFGFSVCLCMSSALSEKDGAGLGTLGFTIPVAKRMLREGGFESVEVLSEEGGTRWFVVS